MPAVELYVFTSFQNIILKEGGVKVCGDAVLRYFWRGFAEIFILTCGISVLLDYAVRGLKKQVWVTVIGDREVSAVLFTEILSSASLVFVFLSQVFRLSASATACTVN